jgi:hypothetical protein
MANDWVMTIGNQYYMNCCPCLLGRDMCTHVGESGTLGCLASCLCPACFQCYMGPKIAQRSGIDESVGSAICKTICCFTAPCYGGSIVAEYLKQRKVEASGQGRSDAGKGQWMVSIGDLYYGICCPCLLGGDVFEHLGKSWALGCLLRLFLPPCFVCYVGPEVAGLGEIPDSCGMAIFKTILPCTGVCYGQSVYVEYKYQKQQGIGASPSQMEMQ